MDGLLPAVVQDHRSGKVLMVGFANREAVGKTLETGHAWFFSRSRKRLWEKGETSGHFLDLKAIRVDCDADALIYLCEPHGPTCHTGAPSCFFNTLERVPAGETSGEAAATLFETIKQRQSQADPGSSYVARLLHEGVDRVAKKIGEEGHGGRDRGQERRPRRTGTRDRGPVVPHVRAACAAGHVARGRLGRATRPSTRLTAVATRPRA